MHGIGRKNIEMYRIAILIGFVFASQLSFAQYDSQGADETSRFRAGFMWFYTGLKPAKVDKVRKYDRLIFDLTYNDWVGDRDPFQNHWASIGLNTNVMFDIPLTKGNKVALGVGVAHQLVKIRHNNHLIRDFAAGTTTFAPKNPSDTFKKSILGGNSFAIPVELRFRNESWRHFKFHIGGKIGYQANLYSKYVGTSSGTKDYSKSFGFPDENKLIYSAHVRLGLRNWALFASYNFNTIFADDSSVQLNLLQAGLSISLY
jgi:hypothetical protein